MHDDDAAPASSKDANLKGRAHAVAFPAFNGGDRVAFNIKSQIILANICRWARIPIVAQGF